MKNRLLQIAHHRKHSVQIKIKRYLFHEIDWNQQLILIKGLEVPGKPLFYCNAISNTPKMQSI
jgi:hypothetical protein